MNDVSLLEIMLKSFKVLKRLMIKPKIEIQHFFFKYKTNCLNIKGITENLVIATSFIIK